MEGGIIFERMMFVLKHKYRVIWYGLIEGESMFAYEQEGPLKYRIVETVKRIATRYKEKWGVDVEVFGDEDSIRIAPDSYYMGLRDTYVTVLKVD